MCTEKLSVFGELYRNGAIYLAAMSCNVQLWLSRQQKI